jgi:type IV pilus assembly protein PilY1
MSRTRIVMTAALLVGAGAGRVSAQATSDMLTVKPLMMLMVDTSGSMERMPDDTRLPDCSNDPTHDASQKNRWTVTLEALTGTFDNFTCNEIDRNTLASTEMDYAYYLPHYQITSATQQTDGILDAFAHRVKFGLMTFDGAGTTLNGDSLVAWDTFITNPFQILSTGAEGMYSYGRHGIDCSTALLRAEDAYPTLAFPDCPTAYAVDAGARGKGSFPGAMVSVGSSEDAADVNTVNAAVQSSLASVRPFGATPLAAMFDDLKYYFKNDTDVKKGTGGDPYFMCRQRYALLITDSAGDADELYRDTRFQCDTVDDPLDAAKHAKFLKCPLKDPNAPESASNTRNCFCPYLPSDELVGQLVASSDPTRADALLHKLFVLAFNVTDTQALASLTTLAVKGDPTNPDAKVFLASKPSELRAQLSALMTAVQGAATSRSVPVRVTTGTSAILGGQEFEITAGFKVGATTDDPWQGVLYRRRIGCNASQSVEEFDLDTSQDDMFHDKLNAQPDSQRTILTLPAASSDAAKGRLFTDYAATFGAAAPWSYSTATNMRRPSSGSFSGTLAYDSSVDVGRDTETTHLTQSNFTKTTVVASVIGDANGNGTGGEVADRDIVVDFVRGVSRSTAKLGDIYYSNPTVLPPLNTTSGALASSDERISAARTLFLSANAARYGSYGRPGVVFVGTNDGILHAFNLTKTQVNNVPVDGGYEFWGFVPPALFSKEHSAAAPSHQSMFDGTPGIYDVSTPHDRGVTTGSSVRTVLVSAVRGAPAYIAIDVTNPEDPKVLWQYADVYMGNTVGRPTVTHAVINWNGSVMERPVVIMPGGAGATSAASCTFADTDSTPLSAYPTGPHRSGARCWKQQGRALYVVDLFTGYIIQRFDPRHFNAPMTGSAVVESPGLGVAQAAYMTDEDGLLWRLSMVDPDPSRWRVQPIWDIFADAAANEGRPSTFPPIITHDPSGNNVILVGTGNLDALIDTAAHRVVSLTDKLATLIDTEFDGNTVTLNWQITLQAGESVTGPMSLYKDTLYFTTFKSETSGSDLCTLGGGWTYGVHYLQTDPTFVGSPAQPRPMLVPTDTTNGTDPVASNYDFPKKVALGVSIARQPVCAVGHLDNDPLNLISLGNGQSRQMERFSVTGAINGGVTELRTITGGVGGDVTKSAGQGAKGGGGSELSQNTQTLQTGTVTSAGSASWASSVE